MNEIDIKQESYFTLPFKVVGGMLLFAGALLLATHAISFYTIMISTGLFVSGLLIITLRYGLKIDVENKTYTLYTWVLGFKSGKPEPINRIDKFFINEVSGRAILTSRAGLQREFNHKLFKAFMKLDNGDKIHVDTDKSLDALGKRVSYYEESTKQLRT